MRRQRLVAAIASAGLLLAWWAGFRGIDFGRHWDEPRLLETLRHSADNATLLPGWYNYPSLSFDIMLAAASAEAAAGALREGRLPTVEDWRAKLSGLAASPAFLLRVRTIFLTLTLLAAVWTGLLAKALTGSPWTGLLATLLVAVSWEAGYHARWVAPDGLVMQWGVLTLLLAIRSRDAHRPVRCLLAAAATASLTFSSKYTGGVVVIPVLALAAFDRRRGDSARARLMLAAGICAVFAIVAVLLTPGFVLDAPAVVRDIQYERHHYGVLGHYGHSTLGWSDHVARMTAYLATAALSPWPIAAVPLAAAAVAGAVVLLRRRPVDGAALLAAPLALALFFSTQRALIARNLLLMIPIMSVLAAVGAGAVSASLARWRVARWAVASIVAAVVTANAAWAVHASRTIRNRAHRAEVEQLKRLLSEDDRGFVLSPGTAKMLGRTAADPAGAGAWLAMLNTECDWSVWPASRVRYELLPSGPFEVNWDHYPGWWGEPRVVLVPPAARAWPDFRDCVEDLRAGRRPSGAGQQ